jgi:Lar family restriction alleviation protein
MNPIDEAREWLNRREGNATGVIDTRIVRSLLQELENKIKVCRWFQSEIDTMKSEEVDVAMSAYAPHGSGERWRQHVRVLQEYVRELQAYIREMEAPSELHSDTMQSVGNTNGTIGDEEPKSCPFCGCQAPELREGGSTRLDNMGLHYVMHCPSCGADGPRQKHRWSAQAQWNRRASTTPENAWPTGEPDTQLEHLVSVGLDTTSDLIREVLKRVTHGVVTTDTVSDFSEIGGVRLTDFQPVSIIWNPKLTISCPQEFNVLRAGFAESVVLVNLEERRVVASMHIPRTVVRKEDQINVYGGGNGDTEK